MAEFDPSTTVRRPVSHSTREIDAGPVFVERCEIGGNGPRVAVKDVIDIQGLPTRAGSLSLDTAKPAARHAEIVAELLRGRCRIIGKTTLHELAYGVTGCNAWAGTPVNVNYPAFIPGGSSSGSAVAVAADLCDFAIGTDTGGSIRIPAACCGIYGLKPTFGRISRQGLVPAESSLDCVGPMAASAEGLATAMRYIDPSFQIRPVPANTRIGFVDTDTAPELSAVARRAAARLGTVQQRRLADLAAAYRAGLTIIARETYAAFGHLLRTGRVGIDVAARLANAATVTADAVRDAERVRQGFAAQVDRALDGVDVLALPTLPDYPPRIADAGDAMKAVRLTALCRPFNLSGHPAIAIPLASQNGPASLQLVARRGQDEILVALAGTFARCGGTSNVNQGGVPC